MVKSNNQSHPLQLNFKDYRKRMDVNLRQLAAQHDPHELDEQAVPAYIHPNRLMAWLFWQRLQVVTRYLESQSLGRVLDFGCGAGVLFPFLLPRSQQLVAYDLDYQVSRFTIENLELKGVCLLDEPLGLDVLEPGTIDTIIALDVLEHVDDLHDVCQRFEQLLSPWGQIVISGPTESLAYRMGRRLAGAKQHFHVRSIYDIERQMVECFEWHLIARLYPPVTLFRVSVARRRIHLAAG